MSMTYDEMKKRANGQPKQRIEYRLAGSGPWDYRSLGAIAGLAGGLIAALFGSVLTAISWFADAGTRVQTLGTVLLFLTIPLLVIGAQCLDMIEKKKDRAREARFHDDQ